MCTVSMIMDHYGDKWDRYPPSLPTQEEINEFKELLNRAREYDKRNNEPNCELKEKRDKILKLAEELGVKIDFI